MPSDDHKPPDSHTSAPYNIMSTFGERLRTARLDKGLKQAEVAEKLGCAATSLTNWESGKIQPSLDVLSRLCEIYEIEPLSLLGREYEYGDLVDIANKPVQERAYEEQIALNFSEPILRKLIDVEAQRKAAAKVEATAAFLHETNLLDRFDAEMGREDIDAVMEDYDRFGGADADILFAFHALTERNKTAFLSMLAGMISDRESLQDFHEIEKAQAFTLERLIKQRQAIRDMNPILRSSKYN